MAQYSKHRDVRWGRVGAVVGSVLLIGLAWNAFDDDDDQVRVHDRDDVLVEMSDDQIDRIGDTVRSFVGDRAGERVAEKIRDERERARELGAGGMTSEEQEEFDEAFEEAMEAIEDAREDVRDAIEDSDLSDAEKERVLNEIEF